MTVAISTAILAQIRAHAAQSPDEVCGLLLGDDTRVTAAVATANVATDPARRFEIDPLALLRAHREARSGRDHVGRVIGHYHSHPSGRAVPSKTDAEMAFDAGMLWLIVAGDQVNAFMSSDDGSVEDRFEPLGLETSERCTP